MIGMRNAVSAASAALLLALVFALTANGCTRATSRSPFVTASPNPVPAGSDAGTTIRWGSGDNRPARVMISVDGAPEALFAHGPTGRQDAPWISKDATYEFRLYDDRSNALLARVTVTRGGGLVRRYLVPALLVVAIIVIVAVVARAKVRRTAR
jgi:hypothetical protein